MKLSLENIPWFGPIGFIFDSLMAPVYWFVLFAEDWTPVVTPPFVVITIFRVGIAFCDCSVEFYIVGDVASRRFGDGPYSFSGSPIITTFGYGSESIDTFRTPPPPFEYKLYIC